MKIKITGLFLFIITIALVVTLSGCSYSCGSHEYVDGNCKNCHVTDTKCFDFTLLNDGTYSISVNKFYTYNIPSEVKIPESYEGKPVTQVKTMGFTKCQGITKIEMPDSITFLDSHAFSSCTSLKEIKLSKNITYIGSGAFYNCTSLESITIPKGVESIGIVAFENCTSITGIKIPNSVTGLGDGALKGCTNLKSVVLGDGITSISIYNVENLCG